MRVAVVSNWALPIGGAQIYAAALAARLARQHEVLMLSGASDLRIPGARCVTIPHLRPLHPGESNVRKAAWHLRDQWRPAVHRAIKRELARFRPDVVHTQEPQGLSASVFTAVSAGPAPHVHTAHDLNILCLRITMTRNGERCNGRCAPCVLQRTIRSRLAARGLDRLISPSDYMRDAHVRAGLIGAEAAVTVRQPASDGPTRQRDPNGNGFNVGFMGTLSPHKGVPTLLETFRSAPSTWRLHLAGDGLLDDTVRAACAVDGRINHYGYVTGAQKNSFFDRLDVLVIPSEYEENAPIIVAEALVRGLPCVVSDRGGLPETPEAWTFRAGDTRSLLGLLHKLAAEPESIAAASAALIRTREDFLWPRHLEQVEAVYEQAIKSQQVAGG